MAKTKQNSFADVHEHMMELGLFALRHSVYHAYCISYDNEMWSELSVLQAAHACEILIKARIAQEHPLLIFEDLPKSKSSKSGQLDLEALFENGRTYQYQDLNERLWATTGVEIPNLEIFKKFGKLRNSIQHFAAPTNQDLSQLTLEFIFEVIDPFINQCWGLFAVDYNEDPEPYEYLIPCLIDRKITFLVPEHLKKEISEGYIDIQWPKGSKIYNKEMKSRLNI